MRCLVGFVCVLALVGSPLGARAQDGDKERLEDFYPGTLPEGPQEFDEDRLGDFYREPAPAPEESALQLKARAGKARAWLIATAVVTAIGVPLLAVGLTYDRRQPPSEDFDLDFTGAGLAFTGGVMVFVGVPGMAASGAVLGQSKRKLRRLEQAHYGTPRRVHWDLAQSRLVF
jgi:hypothetical protein